MNITIIVLVLCQNSWQSFAEISPRTLRQGNLLYYIVVVLCQISPSSKYSTVSDYLRIAAKNTEKSATAGFAV